MGTSKECPVCREPFKRRISGTVQRIDISDDEELCFSEQYRRVLIHDKGEP